MSNMDTSSTATFPTTECKPENPKNSSEQNLKFLISDCFTYVSSYRDGFTEEDFDLVEDPIVKKHMKNVFSMENATYKEKSNLRKEIAMKEVRLDPFDTSSLACQIVAISENIFFIVANFRRGRNKDIKSYRHVQDLLHRRTRLMERLRKKDYNRFMHITRKYDLSVKPNRVSDWRAYKYSLPRYSLGPKPWKFS